MSSPPPHSSPLNTPPLNSPPESELPGRLRLLGSFGSNKVMAGELSRLARRAYSKFFIPDPKKEGPSAISYPFDARLAAVALRYHRTSARVLWELCRLKAQRLEPLYDELLSTLVSSHWPGPEAAGISVQVRNVESFAAGERQIVGTIKNAILDAAGRRGVELWLQVDKPDLLIDVRGVDGELSVALDLAGDAMHRRGYRQTAGEAPLREDVAALLVMLARYNARRECFVDPMAGSGTIGIEAACMASARYNWCSGREPLGVRLPALTELLQQKAKPLFADTEPLMLLNELRPELAEIAQTNVQTAGVGERISIRAGDFQSWDPGEVMRHARKQGYETGLILSNPPYGERLGELTEASELMRELGQWCREFEGWRAGFIVDNRIAFESAFGARARVKKPLRNGQLKATFYLFEL